MKMVGISPHIYDTTYIPPRTKSSSPLLQLKKREKEEPPPQEVRKNADYIDDEAGLRLIDCFI